MRHGRGLWKGRRVRIVLSIERTDGTVSGGLIAEDGSSSPFSSWLELIARIERELDGQAGDPAGEDHAAGGPA